MGDLHGKFVWIELMTSDPKAAEGFYTKVVGWSAKNSGQPGMSYTLLSAGETMVGGLMAIPEEAKKMGARPIWLGYVAVDDVDAYAAKIKAAGGRVLKEPTDVPDMLRFAVVADPYLATFMIMKAIGEPLDSMPAPGTPGTVGWRELHAGASTARGRFIPAYLVGRRAMRWIWAPTANISCSTSTAYRAAV